MSSRWPKPGHFWPDRRVVVTGGSGFLGSRVVKQLRERGAVDVFVPRSRDYDLRRQRGIRALLRDSAPDVVIHLAARVGGIGANRHNPAEFFYDNLMMSVPLLHESWRSGVEKFVAIGSVCAYPKFTPVPFDEERLWDGHPEETNAPYGLAKKMLLVQSQAYRLQHGFDSCFLLLANLYGPGDNFHPDNSHVIPALIGRLVDAVERGEKEICVWGDGSATRDFLYVDEAATAILLAAERLDSSAPVNIGTGTETSVRELVGILADLTGFDRSIVYDHTMPNGQPRRRLKTDRARELLGFQSKIGFRDGLRRTVDWYMSQRRERHREIAATSSVVGGAAHLDVGAQQDRCSSG